jgi:hypothetical protein
VQPVAAWLVARPQNGVLGLALSLLFPLSPVFSGLVMAHLVLARGLRIPLLQGVVAGILLAGIAAVASASVKQIVASAISTWLPILVLAGLMRYWRSLTLTLQVSAIVAVVAVLAFFIVLGDPTGYWNTVIETTAGLFRDSGLVEQADFLLASQSMIAPQMTMLFVFLSWSLYVLVLLLGYGLYQALPGKAAAFGRFRDLNFGRVLAVVMALTSVGAMATGVAWMQNTAFVVFAVFWLQGLAVLHWLHAEGRLPVFVLVIVYALVPFLNVLLVFALAATGYTDAWFDFRARVKRNDNRV